MFSYYNAELWALSSSIRNPAYDFAFVTRAAPFNSPHPSFDLSDWKGKGEEREA
jgi:hypothetical protein